MDIEYYIGDDEEIISKIMSMEAEDDEKANIQSPPHVCLILWHNVGLYVWGLWAVGLEFFLVVAFVLFFVGELEHLFQSVFVWHLANFVLVFSPSDPDGT